MAIPVYWAYILGPNTIKKNTCRSKSLYMRFGLKHGVSKANLSCGCKDKMLCRLMLPRVCVWPRHGLRQLINVNSPLELQIG